MNTRALVKAILGDTKGATAIEYGLIVALVVIAIVASLKGVANENSGLWAKVRTSVDQVVNP
ncbi:MAG: Flp family type IVb pilin [Novosphingobium sp.]|nr:Flp family type IVb pilin [Novosphingobium sp.]